MKQTRDVFVTGGTGYVGRALIAELLRRGHSVRALARHDSVSRVPPGATAVVGDALRAESFARALQPGEALVHLVGTPHPAPSKAAEFRHVDLASILASVEASRLSGVAHLVYVSVAQPAPVMKAYVEVRAEGEAAIREAGLTSTVLRPWYILGPGHRWPLLLVPLYALAALVPATAESARRLGLVTLAQMAAALTDAVEHPPAAGSIRIVDVPGIRRSSERTDAVSSGEDAP